MFAEISKNYANELSNWTIPMLTDQTKPRIWIGKKTPEIEAILDVEKAERELFKSQYRLADAQQWAIEALKWKRHEWN